jgi:hypothetical protein
MGIRAGKAIQPGLATGTCYIGTVSNRYKRNSSKLVTSLLLFLNIQTGTGCIMEGWQ